MTSPLPFLIFSCGAPTYTKVSWGTTPCRLYTVTGVSQECSAFNLRAMRHKATLNGLLHAKYEGTKIFRNVAIYQSTRCTIPEDYIFPCAHNRGTWRVEI
jgi:hypothetical protein